MTEHVNREQVERRFERLRDAHDARVFEDEGTVDAETFDRHVERADAGFTGSAYAWTVRDPLDAPALSPTMPDDAVEPDPHVLLCLSRGPGPARWSVPGGGREAGESYEETVAREVAEETGVDVEVGEPFVLYRARQRPDDGRDVVLHTLWVCFDATYAGGELAVQEAELRGAAWFVDAPGTLGPWAAYRARDWWPDHDPGERWWADE